MKREAAAWASVREAEIRNAAGKSPGEKHTLGEALQKYGEEVSPGKKGKRWELVRLAAFERKLRSDTKARPMWKTHIGWAKDDPFYDKAMKLGAAYRKRS